MDVEPDVVEGFHGVYLLCGQLTKSRTYVGYTVDPNRRIKQHNAGHLHGGARKTSNKGPWDMVLIVHGFPSSYSALHFEWAWQNPQRSRHLKTTFTTKKTRTLNYCLTILWTMLKQPPWCRLPLILRWFHAGHFREPPAGLAPPAHMPIVHGPVVAMRKARQAPSIVPSTPNLSNRKLCFICAEEMLTAQALDCVNPTCDGRFHITCLSTVFLARDTARQILPVEGNCPACKVTLQWGDLIRKRKGYIDAL